MGELPAKIWVPSLIAAAMVSFALVAAALDDSDQHRTWVEYDASKDFPMSQTEFENMKREVVRPPVHVIIDR